MQDKKLKLKKIKAVSSHRRIDVKRSKEERKSQIISDKDRSPNRNQSQQVPKEVARLNSGNKRRSKEGRGENEKSKLVIDNRFYIKKKISQGGFGKVYLAYDKETKMQVVVKVNAETEMNDNEFEIMKALSDLNLEGFPQVIKIGMFKS